MVCAATAQDEEKFQGNMLAEQEVFDQEVRQLDQQV